MFQHKRNIHVTRCAAAALACLLPGLVQAQGSTPYIGQIIYTGFNFPPRNWHNCDGSLQAISQNTTLFTLIGTIYGGDGVNTFALPDMQGRMPIHQGQSSGTSNYVIGQRAGSETQTLTLAQMPAHSHTVSLSAAIQGTSGPANSPVPGAHSLGNTGRNLNYATTAPNVSLGGTVQVVGTNTGLTGGNQPFSIQQPYLVVNCAIALFGVFPTQN